MVYTLAMQRYERIKDIVYTQYAKIYNQTIRIEAISHTSQVDAFVSLLASKRNLNIEICKIIAFLHDYAQYTQNCSHASHAQMGAQLADKILLNTNQFKQDEIEAICLAISNHSSKERKDSDLSECIKDADLLARYFSNPDQILDDIKKERLQKACAQLELEIKF